MKTPRRIVAGIARRVLRFVDRPEPQPALLEMIWPSGRAKPVVEVAAGYRLRQYTTGDRDAYHALLASAGMAMPRMEYWDQHILPGGFFVVEHEASRSLAACCFASHHPAARHPHAGNLGWLAADPAHKGKGLGRAAAAAVTALLVERGYRRIYLETHDFRVPAIKTYLQLGWVPLLYQEDMNDRWKAVCSNADWPFTPDDWNAAAKAR